MTKELIEEARKFLFHDSEFGYEDSPEGDLIYRMMEALAARKPRVANSEDDREALVDKLVMTDLSDYAGTDMGMINGAADSILAAGFSRAAVPDAATGGDYHEGLEEGIKIGRAERAAVHDAAGVDAVLIRLDELNNGGISYEVYSELHDLVSAIPTAVPDAATEAGRWHLLYEEGVEERVELRAERDAALEVLERIREAVSGHPECDRYEEGDVISCGWKSAYASVVAALDGAPEPEWEREYRRVRPDGVPVFNAVFESLPVLDDYYTAEYRSVSQWLPVEGEKP